MFDLKGYTAPVLAVIVTVGGLAAVCFKPEVKTEIIGIMTLVLSFYFGSSTGSEFKNKLLDKDKKEGL